MLTINNNTFTIDESCINAIGIFNNPNENLIGIYCNKGPDDMYSIKYNTVEERDNDVKYMIDYLNFKKETFIKLDYYYVRINSVYFITTSSTSTCIQIQYQNSYNILCFYTRQELDNMLKTYNFNIINNEHIINDKYVSSARIIDDSIHITFDNKTKYVIKYMDKDKCKEDFIVYFC